ncbi:MAG: IscS subfamily cysteine desulfurase [Legionellales bacterium]|nr:IscS subfamily cysteine desulfurase [Legionellales bacterium]
MTADPIYLDYMATTPVDPQVADQMSGYLTQQGVFGNPASQHCYGRRANVAIKQAADHLATLIRAQPREIIWTSGATEANNLALFGAARFYQRQGRHIISVITEHKAVLDPLRQLEQEGFRVTYLTPKTNGLIEVQDLISQLTRETILVSIMQVNNEIGVIQDIHTMGELLRERGILFHVDAAQSLGKVMIDLQRLPVDLMAFSAHKLYGPKGIGALYVRRQPRVRLQPLLYGGGQQHGLRSGTLATHQIVGMGEACRLTNQYFDQEYQRIRRLRDRLWQTLQAIPGVQCNGDLKQRVPHNLNVSVAGVEGESLVLALRDLALSTASACTTASIEPSYVLRAIGVSSELAHSSIRISLGRFTSEQDIDRTIAVLQQQIGWLRSLTPFEYEG